MIPAKQKRYSEQKPAKKFRARLKMIVSTTIVHRKLLQEVTDHKLAMMAKKKFSDLVRTEQVNSVITMADRMIFRKSIAQRTIPERQKLVTLIAGLPMFARLPPKVRARLTTVMYYLSISSGRVVIREGNQPITIYFILTGEIAVTKSYFNAATNTTDQMLSHIAGPGDWVGEVELLEGCPRRQSFLSMSEVELLAVDLDEFNEILKPVLSILWKNKHDLINNLGYFDFFTKEQIITACHRSVVRQFNPLETIYHEDKGQASYVHFVVDGECMILQCLRMMVKTTEKTKKFELVKIKDDATAFPELSVHEIMAKIKDDELTAIKSSIMNAALDNKLSDDEIDIEKRRKRMELRKVDLKAIEIKCGLRLPSTDKIHGSRSKGSLGKFHHFSRRHSKNINEPSKATLVPEHSRDRFSAHSNQFESISHESDYSDEFSEYEDFYDDWSGSDISTNSSEFLLKSKPEPKATPGVKIENHFIDVGSITHGGIFGLGEKMEHRVIMARTTVQCLLIPRYWLTAKAQNSGNVWQQLRIRLDFTIPSRQALFNNFLNTRNWQVFKQNIVDKETSVWDGNPTKFQDIPIIGRIVEHDDYA